MSHIIINYYIENKFLRISIEKNIVELNKNEIFEIYGIIHAIRILEIKKGNEYDNPYLEIKYSTNMVITEYINIFNLCRTYNNYEILKYFINFKEKFNIQNTDTNLILDEYIIKKENISQKIFIVFICNIRSTLEEIQTYKNKLLQLINIDEIYEIIKNEK